jgi:hypothetical protein
MYGRMWSNDIVSSIRVRSNGVRRCFTLRYFRPADRLDLINIPHAAGFAAFDHLHGRLSVAGLEILIHSPSSSSGTSSVKR